MGNIAEILIYLISTFGILSLFIIITNIVLVWLFIRSAVASGTKKGIINAYNELCGKNQKQSYDDFEEEMKGWE